MYVATIDGRRWANPVIAFIPPFHGQYLCIDADRAHRNLPVTLCVCIGLLAVCAAIAWMGTHFEAIAPAVVIACFTRRWINPSRLVSSAPFRQQPRFNQLLAFDFFFHFFSCAVGCLVIGIVAGDDAIWIGATIGLASLAFGAAPYLVPPRRTRPVPPETLS